LPNKSRKEAVDDALDHLGRVAACVTNRPVLATLPRSPTQRPYFGFAPAGEAAPLRVGGRRRLSLSMVHEYEVVPAAQPRAYTVRTIGYWYSLLDRQEREIIAFHWHPAGIRPIVILHLHLSGRLQPLDLGPGAEPAALGQMHIPTGPVAFADVVWLLIAEFGVEPRRADWDAVLASHRDPFAEDG
jgi:hypothetical protein